jgi:hypothetical protein
MLPCPYPKGADFIEMAIVALDALQTICIYGTIPVRHLIRAQMSVFKNDMSLLIYPMACATKHGALPRPSEKKKAKLLEVNRRGMNKMARYATHPPIYKGHISRYRSLGGDVNRMRQLLSGIPVTVLTQGTQNRFQCGSILVYADMTLRALIF